MLSWLAEGSASHRSGGDSVPQPWLISKEAPWRVRVESSPQFPQNRVLGETQMAPDRTDLRHALGELLSTGHIGDSVRPEIAASWQRSLASDLYPERFEVPFEPESNTDDRLVRAARPVLAYVARAGIGEDKEGPLFRPMTPDATRLIRRHLDRCGHLSRALPPSGQGVSDRCASQSE